MKMRSFVRFAVASAMAVLLSACVPPAMEKATTAPDAGKTIIVAKVELIPPLQKAEQKFAWNVVGMDEFKNSVLFLPSDKYRRLEKEPSLLDYKKRFQLKLGETNYTLSDNKSFYVLTGMIMLASGEMVEHLYLPAGFKVDIRKGDQAVYLGTIRYYRDEFSGITKVEVIDDYKREYRKFRQKFGRHIKLKKRLVSGRK